MKAPGVIRQMDELGRIVLPIELRRVLDIDKKEMVEIFVEDNSIILKKYDPNCLFCGSFRDLVPYKDKMICARCVEDLKQV